MSAEARLQELGIELPPPFAPVGSYVAAKVSRGMLYVSGQGPAGPDGLVIGQGRPPTSRSRRASTPRA